MTEQEKGRPRNARDKSWRKTKTGFENVIIRLGLMSRTILPCITSIFSLVGSMGRFTSE